MLLPLQPNICGDPFQDRPSLNYTALFYGIKGMPVLTSIHANLTSPSSFLPTQQVRTFHSLPFVILLVDPYLQPTDPPIPLPACPPAANLTEAQELDVTITISTNHGGRMALRVCPLDRNQASQACFNEPQNQLRR